jgi:hypothetical protein
MRSSYVLTSELGAQRPSRGQVDGVQGPKAGAHSVRCFCVPGVGNSTKQLIYTTHQKG